MQRRGSCFRPEFRALAVAVFLAWATTASGQEPAATGGMSLQALRLRGLTARSAALLMSGQSGGAVPLAVLALPMPASAVGAGVAVVVEAGLEALGATEDGNLRSEIYIYATDAGGAPRGSLTQTFTVPKGWLRGGAEGEAKVSAVRFLGHLEVPPGSYDLRVLVVGRSPERFGLYLTPLEVPELAGEASFLWPPLLRTTPQSGWLFVREAPHGRERRDPLKLLGLDSYPAARPVLVPGEEGEVQVLGRHMGPLPGDVSGSFLGVGEQSLGRSLPVSASLGPPGESLESWRLKVRFEPTGAGAARWQWETSVEDVALPPTREVWLAREASSSGRPWPELLGSTGAAGQEASRVVDGALSTPLPKVAQQPQGPEKLKERELRAVARKYSQILEKLAARHRSQALEDLVVLEEGLIAGRSLPGVETLREVELTVLRKIARRFPEGLVPIIWLYLDHFERSLRERRRLVAVHARLLAVRLIDIYLESATQESSTGLAAGLLTAFGGSLQASSLSTASEAAFRRALELDSGQALALRGLVASYERARQDDLAILQLEKLIALRPEDTEACVRWGRIQLRNDRKTQAETIFRSCIEKSSPAWALAVAYQELALLLGRSNRWQEAAERLEEGHRRLPRQHRIELLRAYALDRLHRPVEGRHAVARLQPSGMSSRESPRARYGRWPRELFALFRRQLEPAVDRRIEALAAALGEEKP